MEILIREIVNVLPYDEADVPSTDEINAKYTIIEAIDFEGNTVKLILPRRGDGSCKNTYLLADAIRE